MKILSLAERIEIRKEPFVTIDPGVNAGFAWFKDGKLCLAALLKTDRFFHLPCLPGPVLSLILERPRVYTDKRKWKGDPNSLIKLAWIGGVLQERTEQEFHPKRVHTIEPSEWKGRRPKEVDNRLTLSLLSEEEKKVIPKVPKSYMHNVLDAIGIGLWVAGRR